MGSALFVALVLQAPSALAQIIETSKDRVVTNLDVKLPYLGSVRPRSTSEIAGSNWLLGCETLDRDFADYDQYKEFIVPLGIISSGCGCKRAGLKSKWCAARKILRGLTTS